MPFSAPFAEIKKEGPSQRRSRNKTFIVSLALLKGSIKGSCLFLLLTEGVESVKTKTVKHNFALST